MIDHLNAFNTVVSQLLSIDIKIFEEEKYTSLLRSLIDSWENLVVAIESNTTTLILMMCFHPYYWKRWGGKPWSFRPRMLYF
jgi:hypothetical protein